jgi:hypothetical protein
MPTRDDFPEDVKRVLANRAANVCSNPRCGSTTSGPQEDPTKALNIGVAAHITAASPGGARYDDSLTPEQRKDARNGIWLCQNCAKLVDNDEAQFPVEYLRAWKSVREIEARMNIGQTRTVHHQETEAEKKARFFRDWVGKQVMLVLMNSGRKAEILGAVASAPMPVDVLDSNEFHLKIMGKTWDRARTIPWSLVEIGDNDKMKCPEIHEYTR